MRWSTICSSLGKFDLIVDEVDTNDCGSFEDMVRASNGELSMLSGGERNGFDMYPRKW